MNLPAEVVPAAPVVSLVLLSWQRFASTTGPCLSSLLAEPLPAGVELLVVDNGSSDGAAQACAQAVAEAASPAVRLLALDRNTGFGGGMNAGVASTTGRWVALVNSDTLWPAGALPRLLQVLQQVEASRPDIALLGPVSNAAGNGQCLDLPGLTPPQIVAVGAQAMAAGLTGLLTPTWRTDFFVAIVRRDAWQALGGLDPVFGLGYYEDVDFSLRLRAAGYEQCIAEDLFIAHVGSASFGQRSAEQRALIQRNHAIFTQRHPHATLTHQRQGNALALAALLDEAEAGGWTAPLRARAAWRVAMLRDGLPRSPVKRWLWNHRQRALRQRLVRHGIFAAYPALKA